MPSMTHFANEALKTGIGILSVTTTPKAFEKEVVDLRPYKNIRVALGFHPQLVFERYSEMAIELYLTSVFGKNISDSIHIRSKTLLSM